MGARVLIIGIWYQGASRPGSDTQSCAELAQDLRGGARKPPRPLRWRHACSLTIPVPDSPRLLGGSFANNHVFITRAEKDLPQTAARPGALLSQSSASALPTRGGPTLAPAGAPGLASRPRFGAALLPWPHQYSDAPGLAAATIDGDTSSPGSIIAKRRNDPDLPNERPHEKTVNRRSP